MAYAASKQCLTCPTVFKANSNKQTYCKPCAKERRRASRTVWNHKYNMKIAETKNAESRAYNKSEKGRAAQKLRDAIRQGKITRQPCEVCGEPNAQGHHTDYSKPYDVRWLCAQHHREEHLFEPWQNELRRAGYKGDFELSRLIEACGRPLWFESNVGIRGDEPEEIWVAGRYRGMGEKFGTGLTPTEAVAKLYLALNKPL